jgi:hypothetical protein
MDKWTTLISCFEASGAALPPGLIYWVEFKNIQEAWVRDVDKRNVADHVEHADKEDCRIELVILRIT